MDLQRRMAPSVIDLGPRRSVMRSLEVVYLKMVGRGIPCAVARQYCDRLRVDLRKESRVAFRLGGRWIYVTMTPSGVEVSN